jgi:hypothetical protein
VRTNDQVADIFTKPLDEKRFCALRNELNIIDSRNVEQSARSLKQPKSESSWQAVHQVTKKQPNG